MTLLHTDAPAKLDRCARIRLELRREGTTVIEGNRYQDIYYCPDCGYWEYTDGQTAINKYVKH